MADSLVESFDGTPIWVTDSEGDGAPVVLVHGATLTFNTNFDTRYETVDGGAVRPVPGPTIASRLRERGARVVGIDLRGHGRSGRSSDPDRYRGDAYAHDVVAVVDALGLEQIDVVGYSLGAMTACRLLGIEPRIRAAVLAGTGPAHIDGSDTDLVERNVVVGRCFRSGDFSKHPEAKPLRAFARLDPTHDLQSLAAALIGFELVPPDRPATATASVMVINGGNDYPEDSEALAAMIPNAEPAVAGDGNHGTACSDDAFQLAIVDFIARRWK